MGNNITELVFILDRSGSMSGMETDTIGGFNSMIERQKHHDGTAYVSTVLFGNESTVLHDRVELQKIEPLTQRQYRVGGCTALMDAIGGAIHHIGNVHKYARPEDVPEKTVFAIITDGMENASRCYSARQVKQMIRRQEERYGWEFLFVAANIDAAAVAEGIGIPQERAANYRQTPAGSRSVYAAVDHAITSVRFDMPMAEDWKDKLDND